MNNKKTKTKNLIRSAGFVVDDNEVRPSSYDQAMLAEFNARFPVNDPVFAQEYDCELIGTGYAPTLDRWDAWALIAEELHMRLHSTWSGSSMQSPGTQEMRIELELPHVLPEEMKSLVAKHAFYPLNPIPSLGVFRERALGYLRKLIETGQLSWDPAAQRFTMSDLLVVERAAFQEAGRK